MRPVVVLLALVLIIATCSTPHTAEPQPSSVARVLLVGDVMVGRGVAPAMAADPAAVFAGVAHFFDGADCRHPHA